MFRGLHGPYLDSHQHGIIRRHIGASNSRRSLGAGRRMASFTVFFILVMSVYGS